MGASTGYVDDATGRARRRFRAALAPNRQRLESWLSSHRSSFSPLSSIASTIGWLASQIKSRRTITAGLSSPSSPGDTGLILGAFSARGAGALPHGEMAYSVGV